MEADFTVTIEFEVRAPIAEWVTVSWDAGYAHAHWLSEFEIKKPGWVLDHGELCWIECETRDQRYFNPEKPNFTDPQMVSKALGYIGDRVSPWFDKAWIEINDLRFTSSASGDLLIKLLRFYQKLFSKLLR